MAAPLKFGRSPLAQAAMRAFVIVFVQPAIANLLRPARRAEEPAIQPTNSKDGIEAFPVGALPRAAGGPCRPRRTNSVVPKRWIQGHFTADVSGSSVQGHEGFQRKDQRLGRHWAAAVNAASSAWILAAMRLTRANPRSVPDAGSAARCGP